MRVLCKEIDLFTTLFLRMTVKGPMTGFFTTSQNEKTQMQGDRIQSSEKRVRYNHEFSEGSRVARLMYSM